MAKVPVRRQEARSAEPPPTKQTRRQYTAEEKRTVARDAAALGVCGAAKKHGIAESNVSRWCRQFGSGNDAVSAPATREENGSVGEAGQAPRAPRSKRVAKLYTPSQRAEAVEYAAAHGVSAAAKALGISRFSIYEWQRKVKKAAAGQGESPTSGPAPADIEAQRDAEIRSEYKRHPGLGPSQIRNQLRRKGVKVSVHTTRRVMEEAGYRPPKVKREPHDERFEAVRPNHLWHLDFVHRHINRSSTFNLILLDDYSRFVVGHGTDDAERADLVIDTFEQAVARYGRPEMVIHDKGSAFWSWRGIARFTALLTELGIDQIEAHHKEWNGKLEVFNANLSKELFDVQRFYDVAEMKRRLAAHVWWYNHERTNHALGGLLVPADRYYGRAGEVLARIEAGAGRDGLDALDLKRRTLELFKVVTENGVPEVWLMGQKLLSLEA
jgi:transposase InsO family protein/transposase-like protein